MSEKFKLGAQVNVKFNDSAKPDNAAQQCSLQDATRLLAKSAAKNALDLANRIATIVGEQNLQNWGKAAKAEIDERHAHPVESVAKITAETMVQGAAVRTVAKVAGPVLKAGAASFFGKRVPTGGAPKIPKLTYDPATQSWRSQSGLVYGQGSVHGNRVKHVMEHLKPDPSKPLHTVFNVEKSKLIDLLDEAWGQRGLPLPNDPNAYIIHMGRGIGTAGETAIRVIVKPGTSEVITAFPIPL